MKVVTLKPDQFDNYAKNHRYRNYMQSSTYANVMMKFGYGAQYLGVVNDENKLIGATLIIYKEIFMSNKILTKLTTHLSSRNIIFKRF